MKEEKFFISLTLTFLYLQKAENIAIYPIFKKQFYFFFYWLRRACGILVPQPGIEPVHPAVEGQGSNHWTAREFSILHGCDEELPNTSHQRCSTNIHLLPPSPALKGPWVAKKLIHKVYYFTRAAVTRYHRLGGWENKTFFLHSSGGRSPRSRRRQGWFLLRPLSLACRWSSSPSVLTWFPLCVRLCPKLL